MSKYTTPNFFCGECSRWQMYGEPDTTWEDNRKILRYCQNECSAWRSQSGASLYTLKNVHQCWHCIHHLPKYDVSSYDPIDQVHVLYPYCGQYNEVIHFIDQHKCIDYCYSKKVEDKEYE